MRNNFDIQYTHGLENKAIDALSRVSKCMSLMALSLPLLRDLDEIEALLYENPFLSNINKVARPISLS